MGVFPSRASEQDRRCAFKQVIVEAMSKSSGERRRRKCERQFVQFFDTLSMQASRAGILVTSLFLVWLVARTLLHG